jgi:hypothetical protein
MRHTLAVLLVASGSAAPSLHGVHLALALAKQLAAHAVLPRVLMLTCGTLASGVAPSHTAHGGVWGFSRVLRLEYPAMRAQSIDTVRGKRLVASSMLLESMTEPEAACIRTVLCVPRLRARTALSVLDAALACGLYALTGGLGGLGLRAASLLVESSASRVLLASRSGRVVRDGQGLETRLQSMGTGAALMAGDSADGGAAAALVSGSCLVTGVLHAAGVLHDQMLRSMAIDGIEAVFAPKALAASHIHAAAAGGAVLEAMGLFSSVASTFGNIGQGNYASANAYLDSLSLLRRRYGIPCSSLQIPAVSGAGIGAMTFSQDQLDAMGSISLDEFATCISNALVPARAMTERTQAPLADKLIGKLSVTRSLVERQLRTEPTQSCEDEALLMRQESSKPRSVGQYVRLRVAERAALLELNDPSHFNALSMEMASDMQAAVKWLAARERGSVRSVALQGAGEHFCPGGNMYRQGAPTTSLAAVARASIYLFDGFCHLRAQPMPVLCAAHGAVLGGGLAICLLTEYVACDRAATFQVCGRCACCLMRACGCLMRRCGFLMRCVAGRRAITWDLSCRTAHTYAC